MKIYTTQVGPIMTNCYLLCDEEAGVCALIDPGDEPARLEQMVAKSGCELQMVLLTHGHFDHCTAVRGLLKSHPDVPVYIHRSDTIAPNEYNDLKFPRLDEHNQRYYAEGDTVAVGGITLTVWETPGHSRGSVCLITDGVIFSGDTLFCQSCGRTDFPDGSYEDILRSLGRLGRLEGNYRVLPGHEEPTDLDFERRFNPYLKQGMSM
ncbi:MAG: MBL fold metallo-hydrolase [Oscillospiraceae bacterium]|nr:MBL fold metallo-hydrolase [Oscillospiraceae bacterium]